MWSLNTLKYVICVSLFNLLVYGSGGVLACVCVRVYAWACLCVHRWMSGVFFYHCPPYYYYYFLFNGLSLSIVFSNLTLAADQPALGILLSPSLHLWDYRFEYLHPAQLFMWTLGTQFSFPPLQSKHSADWANSPAADLSESKLQVSQLGVELPT